MGITIQHSSKTNILFHLKTNELDQVVIRDVLIILGKLPSYYHNPATSQCVVIVQFQLLHLDYYILYMFPNGWTKLINLYFKTMIVLLR